MHPLLSRRLPVVLLLTLTACTCDYRERGEGSAPPPPGATGVAPGPVLEPLPEPPPIAAPPEGLPGEGGELAVVVSRPQGEVHGDLRPTITFSKPVASLASVSEQQKMPPPASLQPQLAGEWRWLGSASVEFVPAGPVPYSTHFTVTVAAGLTALDGAKLAAPHVFEFDTPRPRLQTAEPSEGYRWLTATPELWLQLDQPVKDLATHARFLVGPERTPRPLRVVKEVDVAAELRANEQGRRYPRQELGDRAFRGRQTRYLVTPATPLPLDQDVVLVLDADLPGKDGPLTLQAVRELRYRTYGPMRVLGLQGCSGNGICPFGPLLLTTSNQANPATLRERLRIEPAVEVDWERVEAHVPYAWAEVKDPYVTLPARYRPGTRYRVTVAAGVQDEHGQAAPAWSGEVTLDDVPPSLEVGGPTALLESAGDGALPLEAVNVPYAKAWVWTLTPETMARVLTDRDCLWRAERCMQTRGPPVELRVELATEKNVTTTRPLSLRDALPGSPRSGLAYVRFDAPLGPNRTIHPVVAQLTDLAVHLKIAPVSGVAWVTRLSTGQPVAGARMTMFDRGGKERWRGETDADGLARLPGVAGFEGGRDEDDRAPFVLVSAEKDGEVGVAASTWQGGFGPWSFDVRADWEGKEPTSLGTLVPERGIYRPGDEVHLKGLVRARVLGALSKPLPGSQVHVTVQSSRGKKVFDGLAPLTGFGTFSTKLAIERDAPLGTYDARATVQLGDQELAVGGSFRVEEYRAPQFRVDVSAAADQAFAGDPLSARVLARYLYGGAMAGAQVRWTVARSSAAFEPPGNAGFAFGAHSWLWDDGEPEPSSDVFAGGDGTTDAAGDLRLDLGTAEAPGGRTWEYTLEAEVTDVNRQRVANRAHVRVHPASLYAGLRTAGTGFLEAGKPARLEVVAARPDGTREAGAKVAVELRRREWKSIRKKGVGDRWFTVTEPVEEKVGTCEVVTAATGVSCEVALPRPGLHVAEATVMDANGRKQSSRISFYVVGPGWVSWQRDDTDRLDLVADKAVYDVGETAKLLVKSPFPDAEAVVSVEREGVLSIRRQKLGAGSTVEIPIDEAAVPNVFVGVVLVRGRVPDGKGGEPGVDPGRPAIRVGYLELKVEKKSRRLGVAVVPDAGEKRPREKVRVAVEVKDSAGEGRRAEVAVWAVDEGVLRLTGYRTPDPVDAIYLPRGLSTRIGEPLVNLVLRRRYGEKGKTAGGGGGSDASGSGFRSKFRTTVLFAPEVITDAEGRATVEFELPDNLTTYRLMAMAVTEDDRFGAGEGSVSVSKPLLALPALPRLARVGDSFEAGVVVHTKGQAFGVAEVTATAEGVRLDGPDRRTVSLADGRPHEVRFRFRAEQVGLAKLRFQVTSGEERDGVQESLPVQLPVALEAVATYGDTRDRRVEGIVPPGGVRPGIGGLELTASSTLLGGFDEGMRQLVDYPYGCLEQLASRLVPFVALRELSGKFGLPWVSAGTAEEQQRARRAFFGAWLGEETLASRGSTDPDEVVRDTVRAIERLQAGDGGYQYWPSSDCSSPWASAYAVLALARAQEVGYPVDGAALRRGQAYLADVVAAGRPNRCGGWSSIPDDTSRAFALYALARSRAPRPSHYEQLFARRGKLPLFAQAMLADAMFVGKGDREQARQLLTELLTYARETAAEVHFEESDPATYAPTWSSDTRTTALVLQTLADVSPDHPYVGKLAAYLARARRADGRFRNTQEAAFTLMALAEAVRVKERETPDFAASVLLGTEELASLPFRGRSLDVKHAFVPIDRIAGAPGQLPLTFQKEGPGVLYYGALLRYAPAQLPVDALDRGIVVQRWFEPYTGGGQGRQFYAGDLVRIRVRVGTHMERNYVAIDVPLPSGLEAVDTSAASTAQLPHSPADEGPGEGYDYESAEDVTGYDEEGGEGREREGLSDWANRFWSPFNHVEQRDDRVVLFADRLPPGVHVASFVARATTPGDFVLKPAHAEEMYTPEVFGRSDGGRFQVVDVAPVAAR